MNEPVIFKAFITNLGKYTEGELEGEWVEFPINEDDFNKVLARIGVSPQYEEWFVTDYNCNLNGFDWQELGEYPSYETLQKFGLMIHDVDDIEAVDNVYEVTGNLEDAIEGLNDGIYIFHKGIKTERDWGKYIASEFYDSMEELNRDTLGKYFDYEALGRKLDLRSWGEDDEQTAGEYWCGDEDASETEIGESYVEEVGFDGVDNVEDYFNFEKYGRDESAYGTFTSGGFVEEL